MDKEIVQFDIYNNRYWRIEGYLIWTEIKFKFVLITILTFIRRAI